VTTPTAEPAPTPSAPAPARAAARPAPHGLLAATAAIATVGVVVAIIGLALVFRPVRTPTQDCGTAIGFLLDGRVNVFVSEDDPPEGITPAEARANNAEPCRDRVADRAKPAGVLFLAGLAVALIAAGVEGAVRLRAWLRARRLRRAAASTDPTGLPGPPPLTPSP
jgi:hypothetical protein